MVNISARDAEAALFLWPAARARAVCFYGGEVVGERCMAEIQGAGRDYGVAEALAEELCISRSTNDGRGKGGYVRRFSWARHSRTCRLRGRRTRGDLPGSPRP